MCCNGVVHYTRGHRKPKKPLLRQGIREDPPQRMAYEIGE